MHRMNLSVSEETHETCNSLYTCLTLFSPHTCASTDWWGQAELMSLHKTDGKQWNRLYFITHPCGPLRHYMTFLNPLILSAILTLFWSHKHAFTLLWQCGRLFLLHIYILPDCACYPIRKTPGMSLFYSCRQKRNWKLNLRLMLEMFCIFKGESQYHGTLLNCFFFPSTKPHHTSIHMSNTLSTSPAFSKPISLIASTGPGVIDRPGDTLTLHCT